MKRRDFLKTIGVAAASLSLEGCVNNSARTSHDATQKPNFVFILADDLGWKDLACMGSRFYETPNIDRLAAEGVLFTNAYSNAPNCAPTRACLISGQYTPRHGVYTVGSPERGKAKLRKLVPTPNTTELNTKTVTIAEALKPVGYTSACIGKWHLGDKPPFRPQDRGFDVIWDRDQRSHYTRDGRYLTDKLTDEAVDFITKNKDKPFFLYLSHHAVHTPIQAPHSLVDEFAKKTPDPEHNNPTYAAMISSLDTGIGRILAAVDQLDLAEKTIVIFFSDNGGYANATSVKPLRGSKGMLYEGGIRVPMIVRWPGPVRPRRCDVPVIGIDFYPTILELAAAPKPRGHTLDGCSLVPLLRKNRPPHRNAIFWHFPAYLEPYNRDQQPWRTTPASAVRAGKWKLIEFFESGKLELYNLQDDIGEKKNLAKSMPEKTKELQDLLIQWRKSLNAPVPTKINPNFDAEARAEAETN